MTQARHESGSGDAIKQATHPAVVISGVERTLRTGVEAIASVLVLVEILVLFVGVAARFGFHDPIVWLDELASILFLWLAMFGSVIALQRDEHMALRAIVGRISPAKSVLVQSLVWGTTALFLLMILPSAYDYAADERLIQTPALGVHDTFRAAAVVSGVALMLLTAMSRLLRFGWRPLAVTIGILTILVVGLHFAAPYLRAVGSWNLLFFFVILLGAAVALSVPIGFAFGVATVAYLKALTFTPLTLVVSRMDEGMSSRRSTGVASVEYFSMAPKEILICCKRRPHLASAPLYSAEVEGGRETRPKIATPADRKNVRRRRTYGGNHASHCDIRSGLRSSRALHGRAAHGEGRWPRRRERARRRASENPDI